MNKIIKIFIVVISAIVAILFLVAGDREDDLIENIEPKSTTTDSEIKIIAFGDSLTAGYGLPLNESYPAQLEEKLLNQGYKVKVINSGVSGETTRGNLDRAKFIKDQEPDIVLLGIGGNDVLRQLPLEETRLNVENTILALKDSFDPPVIILLQMQAPLNAGLGYKQSFDQMYTDLAEKHELILLPFITLEVFSNSDYKLDDGIHFNQAGYEQIVDEYILERVSSIIDRLNE